MQKPTKKTLLAIAIFAMKYPTFSTLHEASTACLPSLLISFGIVILHGWLIKKLHHFNIQSEVN